VAVSRPTDRASGRAGTSAEAPAPAQGFVAGAPSRPLPDGGLADSAELYERARRVIPGGVTSISRAGGLPHPVYFERGEGPYLWDVDGNRYVDFVLGYGPLIFGHAPALIVEAIGRQAARGTMFGAQHRLEVEAAELIAAVVPGAEQVVLSGSGTEAAMVALRVARAFTGRPLILKFEGHYHGWSDGAFVSVGYRGAAAGPAEHPASVPGTVGLPEGAAAGMLVAPWNDLAAVRGLFAEHGRTIAAVIAEPLMVNGGVIPPDPGFLEALREITREHGSLLIFDEVITGFRLALGGAQEYYGVQADLAIFAKAIAGGVPLSAVTGPRAILEMVGEGRPAHHGTFNGNPLAAVAAAATLGYLVQHRAAVYPHLHRVMGRLAAGLRAAAPGLTVRQVGPVLHTSIGEPENARNARERAPGDAAAHARFVQGLLAGGVHTAPRGLWYVSTAHDDEHIDHAVEAAARAMETLR
jgi:glutamate-1-semialdehyde 2,1-aminomutase